MMRFPGIRFHDVVRGKAVRALGAATLLCGLIAGQLGPQLVSAQIGGSRTGHIFSLSEDTKINLKVGVVVETKTPSGGSTSAFGFSGQAMQTEIDR